MRERIKKLVNYLDRTIKANNATEPNASAVKRMLENILKGKDMWG